MKKRKVIRGNLLYVTIAVVLSAISVAAACTIFFRVEAVQAEGCERYTQEEIAAAADVPDGTNLVLLPGPLIRDRVTARLPYVDSVTLKRGLPTTLRIVVKETKPAAYISDGTSWWIINSTGKILESRPADSAWQYTTISGLTITEPEQGSRIQVEEGNELRLNGLLGLMAVLERKGMLGEVNEITASSGTEISMVYENRLRVKFLLNADFDRKIRILEDIVALMGEYETGVVNLKSEPVYVTSE